MSGSGVAISKRKNLSPSATLLALATLSAPGASRVASATSYGGELGLNVSF